MVAIIDYGAGNILAIKNIIKKAGGDSVITSDPAVIRKSDKIILPGVGAFDYCAHQLASRNLIPVLEEEVFEKRKRVLGLCVGAQLMTNGSEEGTAKGLGWVNARTVKFDASLVPIIPHMGWTDVIFTKDSVLNNAGTPSRFYFVHSYHFKFNDPSQVSAIARYHYEFACAFEFENISGVQFHPEKSHRFGIALFENFLKA